MDHFLEQQRNALGKHLEGIVLEARKAEHTAYLPQRAESEPLDKFSLVYLEVTNNGLAFWLWEGMCAITCVCG